LVGDAFAFQPLFQRSVARKVRSGETLMATLRFSRVSRARYTSPMPGRIRCGGTISYGPSFVPEATVIGARNYNPVRRAAVDATTLGGYGLLVTREQSGEYVSDF
jgi:hypothetical protein